MKRPVAPRFVRGGALALALFAGSTPAAEWTDTAIGWRVGDRFREPFNAADISKNILSITHASGYKYGNQFVNLDLLKSDHRDPSSADSRDGALEAYVVYRYTLDLAKVSGRDLQFGPIRGLGLTAGFDWNHKDDVAYNSRKRMWVLGPQLNWDVPGRFNTTLLMTWESNAPSGPYPPIASVRGRYDYEPHLMLAMDWGIPLGTRWSFEGFANFIASKGRDEVGQATGPETNIDLRLMLDAGSLLGARNRAFLVGLEYQYWRNKFGNTAAITGGEGHIARTPMVRAEFHF